jgi:hypothetical protein
MNHAPRARPKTTNHAIRARLKLLVLESPRRSNLYHAILYPIVGEWPENLVIRSQSPSLRARRKGFINAIPDTEINSLDSDNPQMDISRIPECYKDLIDVFLKSESQTLPPHRGHLDHHIPLEDDVKPVFGPIYNLSELELKVLKDYIDDKLKKGHIHPSTSPFGSPVLFVKKADGSLCLYMDYRALNRITIKNHYPLPLTLEIMDRIKDATQFTRLDIRDAFNRLHVAEGDDGRLRSASDTITSNI